MPADTPATALTGEQLDELDAAIASITSGPYIAHAHLIDAPDGTVADCSNGDGITGEHDLDAWAARDAAGVAAILNAAPRLLAHLRALDEGLREAVARWELLVDTYFSGDHDDSEAIARLRALAGGAAARTETPGGKP